MAAFEPLVGCHGGLGGWQDRGFVLAPPHLLAPTEPIVGGDELHRHLVGILEALGHRTELQRSTRDVTTAVTPTVTPSRTTCCWSAPPRS